MSESNYTKLRALGIDLKRTAGQVKALCPWCSAERKNKTEQCLSVNIDEGLYNCKNCSKSGSVAAYKKPEKIYNKPVWTNNTKLSDNVVAWWKKRGISQKVLLEMNIAEAKESMPGKTGPVSTLQFPYFENKEIVNIKSRTADKKFKMTSGAKLVFYNIDAIMTSSECLITEGEIDALSFIEAGYEYAVSVPHGASKGNQKLEYLDNCWQYFENKTKIYIGTDNDEPGIALRNELIRRLGDERCFIIDYKDKKDGNEYLLQHGAIELMELIKQAKPVPIEGVFLAHELQHDVADLYERGLPPGDKVGLEGFDDHLSFIPGQMTVITGIPNQGKALDIRTDIPTKDGWKKMGEIEVGDIVFDENGNPCTVTNVTGIMYDRPCYELIFSDGTKIIADEEHQWITDTWKSRRSSANAIKNNRVSERTLEKRGTDQSSKRTFESIKTTKDIYNTVLSKNDNRRNHSVKLCQPINPSEKDLLINPYSLGAWLGDGTTKSGAITIGEKGMVDNLMSDGCKLIKRSAKYSYGISNGFQGKLRQLGVLGNKHIPIKYLRGSYAQRLALLQGLMDTDGCVNKHDSRCEFSVIKKKLAEDAYELITSLGIKVAFAEDDAKLYGKFISKRYRIRFTTILPVFRLQRKLDGLKKAIPRSARFISSCKKIDSVPVKCISVDSFNHLFLCTKSFVPTHNSSFLDYTCELLAVKHKWVFGVFSPENFPLSLHASQILEKLVGKRFGIKGNEEDPQVRMSVEERDKGMEFINDHFYFIRPKDENYSLENILALARKLILKYGINALIIDPWNTLEHQIPGGVSETTYISNQLAKLYSFKQRYNVHLFVVAHPKKMQKDKKTGKYEVPTLYDINMSANFFNKTDNGFVVYRDFVEKRTYVYVQKVKFRHMGKLGHTKFVYDWDCGRFNPEGVQFDRRNHLDMNPQEIVPMALEPIPDDQIPW